MFSCKLTQAAKERHKKPKMLMMTCKMLAMGFGAMSTKIVTATWALSLVTWGSARNADAQRAYATKSLAHAVGD